MEAPVVVSGVKVVKGKNGKYVATDTHHPHISQDGMEFTRVMTALKYAMAKRSLDIAEKAVRKALDEVANIIQTETENEVTCVSYN